MNYNVKFSDLVGKILTGVIVDREQNTVNFHTKQGEQFLLNHTQDCCESVFIAEIDGNIEDLLGTPIVQAEESSNHEKYNGQPEETWGATFTWTFYRISTAKGQVVLRWCGESNGYYSESVDFCQIK